MFVRKKTNHSGTISVVVVSKAHGKFTEVKKFGVAKSEEEADDMFRKAQVWLHTHGGQQEFDFDGRRGKEVKDTEPLTRRFAERPYFYQKKPRTALIEACEAFY